MAGLGQKDELRAGRWDEAQARWIPLPLTRRSATESMVETDHLSVVTVVHWGLARWESRRSTDGSVTVHDEISCTWTGSRSELRG